MLLLLNELILRHVCSVLVSSGGENNCLVKKHIGNADYEEMKRMFVCWFSLSLAFTNSHYYKFQFNNVQQLRCVVPHYVIM